MITAWSYSRWATYVECPRKAKYKFVDKLPEPSAPALERGSDIHAKIEKYLRDGGRVPAEAKSLGVEYRELRKLGPAVELELAYDKKWQLVDWFSRDAWCRVKVDALVAPLIDDEEPIVRIIDHKTGKLKEYGEYDNQLELYGLVGLVNFPTAKLSTGELWFVDHGKIVSAQEEFIRADEKKLKKKWEMRVKPMLSDKVFKPKPGNACRWCHFRKSNNGPCEY